MVPGFMPSVLNIKYSLLSPNNLKNSEKCGTQHVSSWTHFYFNRNNFFFQYLKLSKSSDSTRRIDCATLIFGGRAHNIPKTLKKTKFDQISILEPFQGRCTACKCPSLLKFYGSIAWHNFGLQQKFQQKILIFGALTGSHTSKMETIMSGPFFKISQNPLVGTLAWLRSEILQKGIFLSHSQPAQDSKTCFSLKTSAAISEFSEFSIFFKI